HREGQDELMTTTRAAWVPAAVVAALAVGASACAGQVDGTPGTTTADVPSATAPEQPGAAYTDLELAVLDALADDPHQKAARYEADEDRVVVTVWTQGGTLDADAL